MDYSVNPIWTLQAAYGTGLHAVLENSETNAWKKEVQVSYEKDGVVLTGIIDAVRPIGEHTVHLIDFKFPGQQKRSLIRGDKNTDEIKGYKDQLTSYAALYEQQYGDKVVTASIIFMPTSSKDINMIRTFDVPLTAKAIDMALQKLMARAKVLKEAFDTNIAPGYVESDCLAIFCPPECKAVCELNRQEEMIDG